MPTHIQLTAVNTAMVKLGPKGERTRTRLMFGPQPFSPILECMLSPRVAPRLNEARSSSDWTTPLARHSDRLNDAASAAGEGNVVEHRPSARHRVDTPVFVSVHHV